MSTTSAKVFVPSDTTARSLGADAVAAAIAAEANKRGVSIEIVRNGSRGLYWLEPLVEVEVDGVRARRTVRCRRPTCRVCSMRIS